MQIWTEAMGYWTSNYCKLLHFILDCNILKKFGKEIFTHFLFLHPAKHNTFVKVFLNERVEA